MRIVITGASGLIGKKLCAALLSGGHSITIISRNPEKTGVIIPGVKEFVKWDFEKPDLDRSIFDGTDAVIHLAGANIFGKRWNSEYKKEIYDSRINSTRALVEVMSKLNKKPECFLCSSAVGYYGNSGNKMLTENEPAGIDFLAGLCKSWEEEAQKAGKFGIRTSSIRTGIVLDGCGGALKQMLLPFKMFVGGPLGNGKQWFPWIHVDDLVNTYLFVLNSGMTGPVNAASPNPVTMNEFAKTLGEVLHRPSYLSVPSFVLKIAIGEGAESVMASIKAVPEKLLSGGFKFKFDNLKDALKDLLK